MLNSLVGRLRLVSLLEGASFVVLLFVAMPLKYLAQMPQAVRVVGSAHGILFVALCILAVYTSKVKGWGFGRPVLIMVAALLPFGPFFLDRTLKQDDIA